MHWSVPAVLKRTNVSLVFVSDLVKKWLHKQAGKQETCKETVGARVYAADSDKSKENTKKKKPIKAAQEDEKGN